jgi:hypothetical protein
MELFINFKKHRTSVPVNYGKLGFIWLSCCLLRDVDLKWLVPIKLNLTLLPFYYKVNLVRLNP